MSSPHEDFELNLSSEKGLGPRLCHGFSVTCGASKMGDMVEWWIQAGRSARGPTEVMESLQYICVFLLLAIVGLVLLVCPAIQCQFLASLCFALLHMVTQGQSEPQH